MTGVARTVFLGSGGFAVPILEALTAQPRVRVVGVVTAPPRPVGREQVMTSSPVGVSAKELGLEILTPERLRSPESLALVAALEPDLLVLADYGRIVPPPILALPRHGALNLHPSLLPRHRGASPIPAAILAGDEITGVSLMRMDEGLDTGPIVAQRTIAVSGRDTAPALEERLATASADLLAEVLADWLDGRLEAFPQPEAGATSTRPLRREDGRLDPSRTAAELERQVRAYQPWPGAFLDTAHGRIAVRRARLGTASHGADEPTVPGTLLRTADGEGLALHAADAPIELVEVLPAGGRVMSGAELLRGRPGLVGSRVQG